MEEWRDIEDYEGLYQVSNQGRVRSLIFGKVKVLKPITVSTGYLQITLYKDKNIKQFKVHRLVAKTFLGDWSMWCSDINHKDEDKTNNSVDNLEWCNRQYNINYGNHNKKVAEKLSKPVNQYTLDGCLINTWKSTQEAERNGFHRGNISSCCNGERKTHKGYIWKYA